VFLYFFLWYLSKNPEMEEDRMDGITTQPMCRHTGCGVSGIEKRSGECDKYYGITDNMASNSYLRRTRRAS
jgi:hypothetical protein